ncbi:aldose 1-epimerase [uncultured Aquimarina sp.]|uniref:aldose 1-epimerase n=1 Tax=uncultured Aquimarina sp. TaxID=575652 RepID=UPI0026348419|nr:aldose 1-epimerase [uncultured Aquimarina sp.]
MYKQIIHKEEGLEFIELFDNKAQSRAKISLDQGASLLNLKLNNTQVIAMNPLTYEDTYASSILFPFVNRVKNGTYNYNDKTYQLNCNDNGRNNALHGLVYNKKMELKSSELTLDFGSVTLHYINEGTSIGFPFKYELFITYRLKKNALILTVKVKNTGSDSFPFTIGWHPYFKSENLYNSHVNFNSYKKLKVDSQLIPSGVEDYVQNATLRIMDNKLDDCYMLTDNVVEFITPEYGLTISTTSTRNFLQLYTPETPNFIAIEPLTGIADSLNNEIGLQVLEVGQDYEISWTVAVEEYANEDTEKQII